MEDDIRNQLRRRDRRPAGGAAQKKMLAEKCIGGAALLAPPSSWSVACAARVWVYYKAGRPSRRCTDGTNVHYGGRFSAMASTNRSQSLQKLKNEKWLHINEEKTKSHASLPAAPQAALRFALLRTARAFDPQALSRSSLLKFRVSDSPRIKKTLCYSEARQRNHHCVGRKTPPARSGHIGQAHKPNWWN